MFSTDQVIQPNLSVAQLKARPSGGGGVTGVRVTDLIIGGGLCLFYLFDHHLNTCCTAKPQYAIKCEVIKFIVNQQ